MENDKKKKKRREEKKEKKVRSKDKWDKLYLSILALRKSQDGTNEQIKKTGEEIKNLQESQKKTDELIRNFQESQKKTDEQLRNLGKQVEDLTNSQGVFWEFLSKEGIRKFLQDRGYDIIGESSCAKRKAKTGDEAEFDLVFEAEKDGGKEIFIAEVKSTAKPEDIDKFTERLEKIFEYFPDYEGRKVWGLFSGGRYADGTDKYAIKKGLIAFGVCGDVLVVLNTKEQIKPFKSN